MINADTKTPATPLNAYQTLCQAANVIPVAGGIDLNDFSTFDKLASQNKNTRLAASLHALLAMMIGDEGIVDKVDKIFVDGCISRIDQMLSAQLDEILHDRAFQKIESCWRSLKYLVERTDFRTNTKIEILDVDKKNTF